MALLKITQPGSLLPVLVEQEVTDAQVSSITALLKAPALTYGEVLGFLASRQLEPALVDVPFGAGDSVEAYRG